MRYIHPSEEQEQAWVDWVEACPPHIRTIIRRFDPWTLYRLKSTGQRVTLCSISEDGTLTVAVTGKFNLVAFDRRVFGIDPDDLVSCPLPAQQELRGSMLSHEQVEDNIDRLRVLIRPDLWELDAHGTARRKPTARAMTKKS